MVGSARAPGAGAESGGQAVVQPGDGEAGVGAPSVPPKDLPPDPIPFHARPGSPPEPVVRQPVEQPPGTTEPPAPAPPARRGPSHSGAWKLIPGGGSGGTPPDVVMGLVEGDEPARSRPPAGRAADRKPGAGSSEPPVDTPEEEAGLSLGDGDARHLARELVAALAATYPDRLARARAGGEWSHLLGDVIQEAWADYRRVVPDEVAERDQYFRNALNELLAGGQEVF